MLCPVQWKIEAPAAQRLTTHGASEGTASCDRGHLRHSRLLLKRLRDPSIDFKDEDPASSTSLPTPAVTRRHQEGGQQVYNALWAYRAQLINLFWYQDLPLRQVQEIMKREHGLDVSTKVYKSQFRKWGIRKNIKRQEALALARGQGTSSIFWSDERNEEYAHRIDRHLKNNKHRSATASSHWHSQTWMEIRATAIPRRLRAPDTLENAEAASYYLRIYITGHHESEMWYKNSYVFDEPEAFHSLFVRGLGRLSRNDHEQQAFQDINRAFDYLKQLVERNHPLVYMKILAAVDASAQYPQSEICLKICRLLSEHVRKLSFIIHGPHHPLNHIWSSDGDVESFVFGVALSGVKKCKTIGAGNAPGAWPISKCVVSDARALDESSLRSRLVEMASRPDLLPQVQETRLALSELMLGQGRVTEANHFYMEALAFLDDDPVLDASKLFWVAELKWRSCNALGCLDTLKSALASAEIECMDGKSNGNAAKLKQEIQDAIRHKHDFLAFKKTGESGRAGRRCRVINF